MKTLNIQICMGSSCYARGNARNAELVQEWMAGHEGWALDFSGTLCEGLCKAGPIIRIGDRVYTGVSPESLKEILGALSQE